MSTFLSEAGFGSFNDDSMMMLERSDKKQEVKKDQNRKLDKIYLLHWVSRRDHIHLEKGILEIVRTKMTRVCFLFQSNAFNVTRTTLTPPRKRFLWCQKVTLNDKHTTMHTVSCSIWDILFTPLVEQSCLKLCAKHPSVIVSLYTVKLLWHIVQKTFHWIDFPQQRWDCLIWREVRLLRERHRRF